MSLFRLSHFLRKSESTPVSEGPNYAAIVHNVRGGLCDQVFYVPLNKKMSRTDAEYSTTTNVFRKMSSDTEHTVERHYILTDESPRGVPLALDSFALTTTTFLLQ
jgi:hypothetical protein